jgi:hypothetical protein
MLRARHLYLLLALSLPGLAQMKMTSEQVVTFIKSSIQLKHDDRKVADYVHKIKLTDKLEARKVEELQGLGAGPRTVAALNELSEVSSTLPVTLPPPPPAPRPVIPPPDSIEQANVLSEVTDNTRNYTKNLPNYLCVQVTRRRYDPTGTENWLLHDTIQEQLAYFDQRESYKVTMVNGNAVSNVDHLQLGGAISSGEFGSILAEIFAEETQTEFGWDHWATLRGRRMYVFTFRVPRSRSHYSIKDESVHRTIVAGYHGLIYVDRQSKMVMRYKLDCDDIPADFPIKDVQLDMNYDFIKIAEQEYVLPLKTELRSRAGRYLTWNEAEFHLYRKFGTETTITFDTPDPIPAEKTKEEPAQPEPAPAPKPVVK